MVFEMESSLPGTLGLRVYESAAAQAEAVVAAVREAVIIAVRTRGTASLVVGGGAVARRLYPLLAQQDLPWKRVRITLSDERDVPAGHADSHERLVRDLLLQDRAAQAHFVPLRFEVDAAATLAAAERLTPPDADHDLVLLGLGSDSHIAALFPGVAGMDAALDPRGSARYCVLQPPRGTVPPQARLSMTLAALLDSRRILVTGQGLAQRDAFERAALGHWPDPSPLHALALHAHQPVSFCWCR